MKTKYYKEFEKRFIELETKQEFTNLMQEWYGKRFEPKIKKNKAIAYYKSNFYQIINPYLRDEYINIDFKREELNKTILQIQRTINKYKIKDYLCVYRYTRPEEYRELIESNGNAIIMNSFISTTAVPASFEKYIDKNVLIKIMLSKNQTGLIIPDTKDIESEILLPYGATLKFYKYEKYRGKQIPTFLYYSPDKQIISFENKEEQLLQMFQNSKDKAR